MMSFPEIRLLLFAVIFSESVTGNVLIFSHIGSHFDLMSILAEEVISRGYNVTVVAPSLCSPSQGAQHETVSYPVDENDVQAIREHTGHTSTRRKSLFTFHPDIGHIITKGLLRQSPVLLEYLEGKRFQLAVVDTAIPGAVALVYKLGLPFVVFTCSRFDVHLAKLSDPSLPISYVPVGRFHNGFTHDMTFSQRAVNVVLYWFQYFVLRARIQTNNDLISEYLPEISNLDIHAALKNATLWIINNDFNIEFPYPVMPNVKYVGSLTARPANPLSQELARFVNGSGQHGIILFSLSTLLQLERTDMVNIFLQAFEEMPQRVVWRGSKVSRSESDKIKFMERVPQNDLLGSPNVRVLVTSGGMNGVQEAMFHGVPMVILPLFSDQPDNAIRVEAHGYGVRLDPFNLTPESIVKALKAVIYNNRYKQKMESISDMIQFEHRRRSGRERAADWVEHALKFGHSYIPPPSIYLSYMECHNLDVLACSVGIFAGLLFMLLLCAVNLKNKCVRQK